jgi:hypothetical protein
LPEIVDQYFSRKEIRPQILLYDGLRLLLEGQDYEIEYQNNLKIGIDSASVLVTYIGNYSGAAQAYFTIKARPGSVCSVEVQGDYLYDDGNAIEPQVIIRDGAYELVEGVDYRLAYENNILPGKGKIIITYQGDYEGTVPVEFKILSPIPDKITSSIVSVDEHTGYISKLTVGTTVRSFIDSINEKEYIAVYQDNTKVSDTALIGTGMFVHIMDDGKIIKTYTLVVTGDSNGDGKINITDMLAVKACVLKKSQLTGANAKACDVNGDGKVNITDFIKVKAVTLKKDTIVGVTAI